MKRKTCRPHTSPFAVVRSNHARRDVAHDEHTRVRARERPNDVVDVAVVLRGDVDARRRGARETRARVQRIRRFGVAYDEYERRARARGDARGE